ncbi:hypothetical protein C0585_02380 [Candidatus Woesearchaeota archaeon]|nr:MAG: hypothetical protein C0585_02380 [Candidatus Woesearchaeota archaeon]
MKRLILILILIFLSLNSIADVVYSGDTITRDEDEFRIYLAEDESHVMIRGFESMILNEAECKVTPYYEYCFEKTVNDFNEGYGKWDDDADRVIPALFINITEFVPEIKVTRKLTTTSPYEHQKLVMDVTIKNEGNEIATVRYSENVSGFSYCINCLLDDGLVTAGFTLSPDMEKLFSYKLEAEESFNFTPNVTFKNDIMNGTVKVDTIKMVMKKALSVSIEDKKPVIEEPYTSRIEFTNNNADYNINFDAKVYYDRDYIDTKEKEYSASLSPGESQEFNIDFTPIKSGKNDIIIQTDYFLSGEKISANHTIEIENLIEKPEFLFSVDQSGYADIMNNAYLNITNGDNTFQNFYITITLGSDAESFILPKLRMNNKVKLYDKEFVFDSTGTFDAKLNATYKSIYGEEFTFIQTKKVTVKPVKDMLEIIREVRDGKKVTYIKNNNEKEQAINITEISNGKPYTNNIVLLPNSKKLVLTYEDINESIITKLMFSGVKNDYLFITDENGTEVEIEEHDYEEKSGVLIDQDNLELEDEQDINVDSSVDEKIAENPIEEESVSTTEEKKGFFKKIWDIITSFF